MVGLICGAACALGVIGLMKAARRHAFGYGYGGPCGRGYGGWHDGGHSYGPPRGRMGGFGFRMILRRLFERLETTPGQEKAIVAAASELREAMSHARDEMKGTRKDFADAFRRGPIDEASVADIFVRHDTIISETRRKVVEAAGRIHEALDERQREEVADLLEHGPGFGHFGRHGHGHHGYRW